MLVVDIDGAVPKGLVMREDMDCKVVAGGAIKVAACKPENVGGGCPLLAVLMLILVPFEFDPNTGLLNAFPAGDGDTRNGDGTVVGFPSGLERARGNLGAGAGLLLSCPLLIA